ncbi:MAG: MFS transporter [Candidatus Limnocylindrales bacterium]
MSRTARLILLAALSVGVFLVGVELMVTAVALPAILNDLADWTQLREASWIINGYLVAYVAAMPLAGRAADRFNLPALFAASLGLFAIGSLLVGAAPDLGWLIGARVIQGLGAGAIVPLATAGASHLFGGPARARAIGVVGALTFLGMAAGPFVGATILQTLQLPGSGLLTPSWRWIFYLGVPFALLAVLYTWAASVNWPRSRDRSGLDLMGAGLFTIGVTAGLLALTTLGVDEFQPLALAAVSLISFAVWLARSVRTPMPFIDLRFFRDRTFSGAVLLSLLTGYGLATAIIGGAVFVDRVRYAGPPEQQLALGGLAGAMALGALGSGLVLRRIGVVVLTLFGLALSVFGLWWLSTATPTSPLNLLVGGLSVFGFGFGLTVTARSTAAVEALGKAAFGLASAAVTVARMLGMGVGLAALTVLGSSRIEALSVVLVDQAARDAVLPPALRGRPLEDYLVVSALETWAAGQAASILSQLFLVAAIVSAVAILPTLAMRNRPSAVPSGLREQHEGTDAVDGPSGAGIAI